MIAFYRDMGISIPDNHAKRAGHDTGPAAHAAFLFAADKALLIPIDTAADAVDKTGRLFAVAADYRGLAVYALLHVEGRD